MTAATSSDGRRLSSPRPATNTLRTTAGQKSKMGQRASTSATRYLTLSDPRLVSLALAIHRRARSAFFLCGRWDRLMAAFPG